MTQALSASTSTRLRMAGAFVLAGLVVEALSLWWNHPLAFVAFLVIGGLLLAIGIVIYLLAVLAFSNKDQSTSARAGTSASSATR
jgi:predicted membrane channel-forming protein YqfA (hemolysin III family)